MRPFTTTAALALAYLALLLVGNTDGRRWLYLVVSVAIWAVFVLLASRHVRTGRHVQTRPVAARPVATVVLCAALVQLPGMFFAPASSTDLNRYAWDGRVQLSGADPYRYVPFDDRLAELRDPILFPGLRPDQPSGFTTEPLPTDRAQLLEHAKNYPSMTVLSRPRFPTPYPPVAEAYYTLVSALTPWSWGTKGFQIAGGVLAVAVSALLARGMSRPLDALVFAWSPPAVLEAGQGGHVDILGALFVLAAVLAWRRTAHPLVVGLLMGLAAGVKLTPFTMLPAFTPWRRLGRSIVVGASAIGLVVASYVPHYLAVGPLVTGSIGGYLTEENGENRASILALLLGTTAGSLVGTLVTLGVGVWAVFRRGNSTDGDHGDGNGGDGDDPAWPALVLFSTLLVTTTPVLAWYCLPVVALATLLRRWEFYALGIAGALAYGGHSYYPMTPAAYALALVTILWVQTRRWRAAAQSSSRDPVDA